MNFSRFYSTLLSFMFPSFPAESLLLPPKGPLYSLFFCVCMCVYVCACEQLTEGSSVERTNIGGSLY